LRAERRIFREARRLDGLAPRCAEAPAAAPRPAVGLRPALRRAAGAEIALDFGTEPAPDRARPAAPLAAGTALDRRAAVRGVVDRRAYSCGCGDSSSGRLRAVRRELVPRG